MEYIQLLDDVGFPIAAALAAGGFVFITLKFILTNVADDVRDVITILEGLDRRIDYMTTEMRRIDIKISLELGVRPDCNLVTRAKPEHQRRD